MPSHRTASCHLAILLHRAHARRTFALARCSHQAEGQPQAAGVQHRALPPAAQLALVRHVLLLTLRQAGRHICRAGPAGKEPTV